MPRSLSEDRPERVYPPSPPLLSTAARLGNLCWVEFRLFEILGGWVQSVPEPEAKLLLARQTRRHSSHAELFAGCLPVSSDLDRDELVGPRIEELADVLAQLERAEATRDRLLGLHRVVLPGLEEAVASLAETLSPVADAPALRVLRLVGGELHEERQSEEDLLGLSDVGEPPDALGSPEELAAALRAVGGF